MVQDGVLSKGTIMKEYQPNFSDPRVKQRILNATIWAQKYLSPTKSHWLSTREIDRHLGSQRNQLSKYLRGILLICTNDYYNIQTKKCKEYLLSQTGLDFLLQKTNQQLQYTVVDLPEQLVEQLASGQFQYKDSSSRLFNPIQNIKRTAKKKILAQHGYKYEYDIQCCAFTLIMQYAQECGMDEYPIHLNEYIRNRSSIRQRISHECEITPDVTKRIINALLLGAQISHDPKSSLIRELDGDHSKVEWFKQDQYIQNLKEDIKMCWTYIRPSMQLRTTTTKSGITKKLPITSKQKASLYRDLERRVLNEVRTFLEETSERYFLEHDGWATDTQIDIEELTKFVRTNTGFNINIEFNNHD